MSAIELCPCPCCRRRCPILQKDFSNFVHLSEHQLRAFQPISTKGNQDSDHIHPPPFLSTSFHFHPHIVSYITQSICQDRESNQRCSNLIAIHPYQFLYPCRPCHFGCPSTGSRFACHSHCYYYYYCYYCHCCSSQHIVYHEPLPMFIWRPEAPMSF